MPTYFVHKQHCSFNNDISVSTTTPIGRSIMKKKKTSLLVMQVMHD